jgi:hypothetical protein
MFKQFNLKMENANDGAGGSGGGASAAPNIADGAPSAGAAQQPVGGSPGNGGSSGANGGSWLDALPDDIKKDPSLAMFKEPSALAKSWVNAQKMIGADKVVIPNDKATEEDWGNFYKKLGRPEAADKYEIKTADGQALNEEFAKGFKEAAFKSGLSAKQVSSLAEWYMGMEKATAENSQQAQITALRNSLTEYTQKLGGEEKFKDRVDDARLTLNAIGTPELKEFLKTSGLGSRPEMIEFFAALKPMMDEGKIRDGTGVPFAQQDITVLQRELDEIEKNMFNAPPMSSNTADLSARALALRERINTARQKSA